MEIESSGCSDPLRLAAVSKAHGQRFTSRLESEYDEVAMHDGYQCRHSSQSCPRSRQLWWVLQQRLCSRGQRLISHTAVLMGFDRTAGYATPSGVSESHAELG